MTTIAWLSVAVIALFAAAWLAIWSRRDTLARPVAVVLFMLGLPTIVAAGVESLGWHKPLGFAWDLTPGDHRVLSAKLVQDEAIYLYLDDPARLEPRPIIMPWNNEAANRIQKLQDGAGPQAKGQFVMRYEKSLDMHAPQFHPLPQPQVLPPKPRQERAPHYDQRV